MKAPHLTSPGRKFCQFRRQTSPHHSLALPHQDALKDVVFPWGRGFTSYLKCVPGYSSRKKPMSSYTRSASTSDRFKTSSSSQPLSGVGGLQCQLLLATQNVVNVEERDGPANSQVVHQSAKCFEAACHRQERCPRLPLEIYGLTNKLPSFLVEL